MTLLTLPTIVDVATHVPTASETLVGIPTSTDNLSFRHSTSSQFIFFIISRAEIAKSGVSSPYVIAAFAMYSKIAILAI
jgi:hypothetical protein